LRIIAGIAKGRRIEALPGLETRPTLDRVKESLFGSIQFEIEGKTVLDLFSGSGNLGLEAASRGAAHVVLNDISADCAAVIRKNAERTGLTDRITVTQYDFARAIEVFLLRSMRFDIALLDAPYASDSAQRAAELLFAKGLIRTPDGFVIVEHAAKTPPRDVERLMRAVWTRRYGDCGLTMLKGEPA